MQGLGINIADYSQTPTNEGGFGVANTSVEALQDLSKALEAGSITGRETNNLTNASGSPLKVESLERTLKLITFRESDIVLWKNVPKDKAYNTVEEFNQLDSYGSDRGGFILEGELPQEEDSRYVRRSQLVKFLGVVKSVTHVLTLTNNVVGNLINKEAQNGSLWILRKLNRSLVYGDQSLVPQEFNGLFAQHMRHDNSNIFAGTLNDYFDSEVVVDMRGSILTEAAVEDAAEAIVENFGQGTDLFAPPKVFSNFAKQMYQYKHIIPNTNSQTAGYGGQMVPGQVTNFGKIEFNPDIFLRRPAALKVGVNDSAGHPKAPATPVPDGSTPVGTPASDALSKWVAADAGDYIWGVQAFNRFGMSAFVKLDASATTMAAGEAVDLKWAAGSGGEAATGYRVWRSPKGGDGNTFYWAFDISAAELAAGYNGGSAGLVRDRNFHIPGTDQAFLIENNINVHCFKQLAPLMKMDLAVVSPAYRFMVLMYGTPMLFAPKKMVRFVNIGDASA